MSAKHNIFYLNAIKSLASKPESATVAILAVMLALTAAMQGNFFTAFGFTNNVNSFVPLVLLTMGQAVVLISGGLDLSCGPAMSLILCIMTQIMRPEKPLSGLTAIVAAFAVSIITGVINGTATGALRLPPVIATFATSYMWLGASLFVTPTPGGKITPWFRVFYDLRALPFMPRTVVVIPTGLALVGISCALWYVIKRSRLGRYIYAVGSSADNAFACGIETTKIQISAYVINAVFIFLCALYFAGQNGAGSANIGSPLTLQAIASAVVGGVAISGGKGGVFMAIAGAVIMGLVSKLLYMFNVPNSYQTLVSGIIIIAAIASSAIYAAINKRALLKGGANV